MRTKIGTVLDDRVLRDLKIRADKEGRNISDVIQEALVEYFAASPKGAAVRLAAVDRLCSRPFEITKRELAEILEEDFFGQ